MGSQQHQLAILPSGRSHGETVRTPDIAGARIRRAITLFAGFFISAIANIKRPEAHKRLILLATVSLLQAAMGRVFFLLVTGGGPGLRPGLGPPPPLSIGLVPSLIVELIIVAGIVYDWRTRGRPHPVWLIGAAVITAVILLRGPLSGTPAWLALADALAHFAG